MPLSILEQLQATKKASHRLANISEDQIDLVLLKVAEKIRTKTHDILQANQKDLSALAVDDPLRARLILTDKKIREMAESMEAIRILPSPIGRILEERTLPNGLLLTRQSVPLGVVGVIYEARPNVTPDVFSLCFKSRNACVLKGGSDAYASHNTLVGIIKSVLRSANIDENIITLLPADRTAIEPLLTSREYIDVIIPRGGAGLIQFVREHARVPVIETGAGVVHTYVDHYVDIPMAARVIENAKTNRPAACNALDTLLIHRERLADLPTLLSPLVPHAVTIRADESAYEALNGKYPGGLLHRAMDTDYGHEFLSLALAVKTVDTLGAALTHIRDHGSGHSEAILSRDGQAIKTFLNTVDAAAVYANTATVFTDGGQFGLGCEVGISTQKLHARGPMGLDALTSYKWIIRGHGQTRT